MHISTMDISLNGYIKSIYIGKKYTVWCLANQVINPITYTGKVCLCVRLHCLLLIELTSWGESLRLRWHPWDICGIAEHFPLTFLSRRWMVINSLHIWTYIIFDENFICGTNLYTNNHLNSDFSGYIHGYIFIDTSKIQLYVDTSSFFKDISKSNGYIQ